MSSRPALSIKTSLFLGLGVIFALSALAMAAISIQLIERFGNYAADANQEAIRAQAYSLFADIIKEEAGRYGGVFRQAEADASALASQAAVLLENAEYYGRENWQPDEKIILHPNGFHSVTADEKVYMTYCCKEAFPAELEQDYRAFSHLGPLLVSLKENHPEYVATWASRFYDWDNPAIGQAIVRYYPNSDYAPYLPDVKDYITLWDRSYATTNLPKNNPNGEARWTLMVEDDAGQGKILTVTKPIWDDKGTFYGAAGIDITLDTLLRDILGPPNDPDSKTKSAIDGRFFILLDEKSEIVAAPLNRLSLLGLREKETAAAQSLVLNLNESESPAVRELAGGMRAAKRGRESLHLGGDDYVVFFHSLFTPAWTLALVVPEEELFASVRETRRAITATVGGMTWRFGLNTAGFLGAAFLAALLFFRRRVFTPLDKLTRAIGRFSKGDKAPVHDIGAPGDELNRVALSFENMAREIHAAQQDLCEAKQSLQNIFENVGSGLFQTTAEGTLVNANPAMARILGFESAEALLEGAANITGAYRDPEARRRLMEMLEKQDVVEGFETEFVRRDGAVIWVSINAKAIRNALGGLQFIDGVLTDVTGRKLAERRIRDLGKALARTQEVERLKISRDLHDEVIQNLYFAGITADSVAERFPETPQGEEAKERLRLAGLKIKETAASIRDLSQRLRPPELERYGLAECLRFHCEDLNRAHGLAIEFSASGLESAGLTPDAETNLFRLVQEAVGNAVKHAGASRIRVEIVAAPPTVAVSIRDDGKGFDPAATPEDVPVNSMGLRSMRERARLLGGELDIQTQPGEGVTISLEFPIH